MTLDLGKCALCDTAIVYEVGGKKPLCPDCGARLEKVYGKVRSLLRDYADRRLSASDVARILKVDEREINYLIEDNRFERVDEWQLKDEWEHDHGKKF